MSEAYLKDFTASSWLTTFGVRKKRKEIESKGLPNLKGCLFFTLTIDPSLGSQRETYDKGKDKLRRFLDELRKYWGTTTEEEVLDENDNPVLDRNGKPKEIKHVERYKFGWAWKLEFQDNGYAHWHLLVKTDKRIALSDLPKVNKWWGLGRTNLKKIKRADFEYLFKYVSKCAAYEDGNHGLALPEWVLDYQSYKDGKPQMRIRFWQTRGFYEPKEEPNEDIFGDAQEEVVLDENHVPEEEQEQKYSIVRYTIREFVSIIDRVGLLVVQKGERILFSAKLIFDEGWLDSRQELVNETVKTQTITKVGRYPVFEHIIKEKSEIWRHKTHKALERMKSTMAMA